MIFRGGERICIRESAQPVRCLRDRRQLLLLVISTCSAWVAVSIHFDHVQNTLSTAQEGSAVVRSTAGFWQAADSGSKPSHNRCSHFLIEDNVKDEYEDTLGAVEESEDPCESSSSSSLHCRQESEDPRDSQETQKCCRSLQPSDDPSPLGTVSTLNRENNFEGDQQEDYVGSDDDDNRADEGPDCRCRRVDPAAGKDQSTPQRSQTNSLCVRAVIFPFDSGGNRNYHSWATIAEQIIKEDSGTIRLENLDEHHVQLVSFEKHPTERGEEEVMKEDGDDSATCSVSGSVHSWRTDKSRMIIPTVHTDNKNKLCNQKTQTKIAMDGVPNILQIPEECEDAEAEKEADDRDGTSDGRHDVQSRSETPGELSDLPGNIHEDCKTVKRKIVSFCVTGHVIRF